MEAYTDSLKIWTIWKTQKVFGGKKRQKTETNENNTTDRARSHNVEAT